MILFIFKYFDLFASITNKLSSFIGIKSYAIRTFDLLLPVGISFYTFQALGYIIDVYRSTIKPEKNLLKYALFISFFPQLVAGPIERSSNMLHQIHDLPNRPAVKERDITSGVTTMLWGYFLKMVIADRAAILVNNVYDLYWNFGFYELSLATIFLLYRFIVIFPHILLLQSGRRKFLVLL